jgi:hypothetical protein
MSNKNITNFGTVSDILKSINSFDENTLRETLAYIIKVYILDKGISYEGQINETSIQKNNVSPPQIMQSSGSSNFRELIMDLKRTHSFPELKMFSIENDELIFTIDGKKHTISKRETVERITDKRDIDQNNRQEKSDSAGRFNKLEMD